MGTRLLVVLIALLAAVPALSGCGSSETLSSAAVAKVADATVAKGGTKIALTAETTAPGVGKLTLAGEGAVDGPARKGQINLRVTDAPALPASVKKETLSQELVFDGFTFYIRSQIFDAGLKDGKKWVKIDLVEAGKEVGIDLSMLAQGAQDPTQSLRLLKAISGEIENVGEEEVRGVQTTHYKGTIDLEKFPDTVAPQDRAAARATIKNVIKLAGSSKSPVEFWIGEDDLVRRVAQSSKVTRQGATTEIKQRVEFYDYGTKVDVTIPPPDEVQDLTELTAAGLAGQAG